MSISFVGITADSSNSGTSILHAHPDTQPGDVLIAMACGKAETVSIPTVTMWPNAFGLMASRLTLLQSSSPRRLYGGVWMKVADVGDPAQQYEWTFPGEFLGGLRGYGIGIATFRGAAPPYGASNITDEEQRTGTADRTPAEHPVLTTTGTVFSVAVGQTAPLLHPGGENGFERRTQVLQIVPTAGLSGAAIASQTAPQSAGEAEVPTWTVPGGETGVIQFFTFALIVTPGGWNIGSIRMGQRGGGW